MTALRSLRRAFVGAKHRDEALSRAPWAEVAYKVAGGFMLFETEADFRAWRRDRPVPR
jgi:hypothetical protein